MKWTPSSMGKKGGAAKGTSKVRGDSEYYKAIWAKRRAPKTLNTTNSCAAPGSSEPSDPNGSVRGITQMAGRIVVQRSALFMPGCPIARDATPAEKEELDPVSAPAPVPRMEETTPEGPTAEDPEPLEFF